MNTQAFTEFIDELSGAVDKGLPGVDAQYIMAPKYRPFHTKEEILGFNPNMGGVLVYLYPNSGQPYLVLMLRQSYDGVHSGQVSFPGGRFEEGDDELQNTAIREANEEVNIEPANVKLIIQLTELYIPPSNFYVFPYLAFGLTKPNFQKEEKEVAEIIEMPLEFLIKNEPSPKVKIKITKEYSIFTPAFEYENYVIWGATGMILSELREIVKRIY